MGGPAIGDQLALLLDVQGEDFLNLRMDVSGITIMGACGDLGTLSSQTFRVRVYDNPGAGAFDFDNPGTLLSQEDVADPARTGLPPNEFLWAEVTAGLDVSGAQNGNVVIEWSLLGTYAALDNIVLTASDASVTQECPENVTIEAAGPSGTVYNYTASVTAWSTPPPFQVR